MNKFFCLIILLSISYFAKSQNFGLKAGTNFSSLINEGDDFDFYETTGGFVVGIFSQFHFSEKSSFLIETSYSMEGAGFQSSNQRIRVGRITFPLLLEFDLIEKLKLQIGPEFKLLLSAQIKRSIRNGSPIDTFNTWDYGIAGGFAYLLSKNLKITARNYFGFVYPSEIIISDQNGNITDKIRSDRSLVLSLGLMYFF